MLIAMPKDFDGPGIARRRIADEAERRTGFLDLGMLGLTELPAGLLGLRHLRQLNLGDEIILDDGTWFRSPYGLRNAVDLHQVTALPNLEVLSIRWTNATDLEPVARLRHLRRLDCFGTQISDLKPLSGLTNLQSFDCSFTRVADLETLSALPALQSLSCHNTPVADLQPLASAIGLRFLSCYVTEVAELRPLASLAALQSLVCSATKVSDLRPLAGLTALQSLSCSGTKVVDLAPLAALKTLQSLNCSSTQVADLQPLAALTSLRSLNCSQMPLADLELLAALTALQSFSCHNTRVADLNPLASLARLRSLDCSFTPVADLSPLAGLLALQSINCCGTMVVDLQPLAELTALQSIDCSFTGVVDLRPLAGLAALQSVDCNDTQVADLGPLTDLALRSIDCTRCRLVQVPDGFWEKPSLEIARLYEACVPDVPAEVLSQQWHSNCLASLRAHLRDLDAGSEPLPDVKLLVIGNGRAGKTQLCRRLRGEAFQAQWDSTHGILVTAASLPATDGDRAAGLHIWDFGGQDIYHGTHALLVQSRAVFLLLWAKDSDNADTYEHVGIRFRNRPLAYWVDYVRHLGDADSPVLIVQTQCDRPEDEVRRPPVSQEALDALGYAKELHYSAKPPERGRAALDEALRDAIDWLQKRQGTVMIGAGRLRVQRRLEAMRDADAAVPPERRQHRTLSKEAFHRLCDEAKGVSAAEYLLSYLNNTGIVFYRPGLFGDQVVLGQGWALDAIYAVFNREKCYRQLRHARPFQPAVAGGAGLAGIRPTRAEAVPQHDAVLRHLLRSQAGDVSRR